MYYGMQIPHNFTEDDGFVDIIWTEGSLQSKPVDYCTKSCQHNLSLSEE